MLAANGERAIVRTVQVSARSYVGLDSIPDVTPLRARTKENSPI